MNDQIALTTDEVVALRQVNSGRVIPADMQKRLIKLGYIEQKLGGLVVTLKGILKLNS